MKNIVILLIFILVLSAFGFKCQSQNETKKYCNEKRLAAYAGSFYEADKQKLNENLDTYFENAVPYTTQKVLAIISPHAGYVFSGQVAASAFNQVNPDNQYKRVFILAPSHRFAIDGAALYCKGNFETPLGEVEVDCDLANKLIKESSVFQDLPETHKNEHAIEVELPFLQKRIKTGYKIVPIVIGTREPGTLKKIAAILKPYLTAENLFVISSDFSHYPSYKNAVEVDKASALAIAKNSPKDLEKQLMQNAGKSIPALATSMCGEAGIMCLLYMTSDMEGIKYQLIDYKNSGDSKYGDKDRVVGYWAIALVIDKKDKSTGFELNKEDKEELLKIARKTLEEFIKKDKEYQLEPEKYTQTNKTNCGAFVTLTKKGVLRGCIGSFSTDIPLYQVVHNMSISASSEDPRFPKVKSSELSDIEIEISVLTPMQKIDSISQLKVGKHGIYIKNGFRHGTLLPQVAPAQKWTAEEFVKYCALHKAGIPESDIKNSELYVYEAIVFHENRD